MKLKHNEAKYSNKNIVELLRNVAASYLLKNEIRFKVIAYEKAADTVEHLSADLKDIWEDGKLKHVAGIGPAITQHLSEYFEKGVSKHFQEVMNGIPPAVFILMRVSSIGPKKSYKLAQALNLDNPETAISDLKAAAEAGKIESLPTFGKKSQEDIISAINLYLSNNKDEERMPLPYAHALALDIIAYLNELSPKRIDALGSMRRMVSTIGDIDIAVAIDGLKVEKVIEHFIKYPKKVSIDNAGEKKASIILKGGIRVDFRVQENRSYGSMLQYFTGSKAHNVKLREYAIRKGYSLSEWGIKKIDIDKKNRSEEIKPFATEKELYNFFGLQYIPPEIREGTNEIELALKNKIPALVDVTDIKGDLHLHSSYDLKPSHDLGNNTYVQIMEKGKSLGYEYVGFADHNPKQSDLSEKEIIDIMKQRREFIDKVLESKQKEIGFFVGLEVDILPSGKIALPEKAIDYVDYLTVSVHSSFRMSRGEMTKRVLTALSFPKVRIFGHPTGRLINKRPGIDVDWDQVFDTVKKNSQALEINSWPERLDLPDTLVRDGQRNGVKFVIDTDAHANEQMENMIYGASVARRGWLTKDDIMNTFSYKDFKKWLIAESR